MYRGNNCTIISSIDIRFVSAINENGGQQEKESNRHIRAPFTVCILLYYFKSIVV
jgi:hypothetical protein